MYAIRSYYARSSRASCCANIMYSCCPAAFSRATRKAEIPGATTYASHWSPRWRNAWRRCGASRTSLAVSRGPMNQAQAIIDQAWEDRAALSPAKASYNFV